MDMSQVHNIAKRLIDAHGTPGLRSTRLQVYRAVEPPLPSRKG